MSLTAGSRLGLYEIVSSLGAGGMGEVYRARDTRLERHVALKLILEAFVAEPDRAMRFEREARTLAALNHRNIATLYGLEQADGRHFLVMELVDGETLAERITRHPRGLPLEDALRIASQIAEAVEAAHEKGVVHRDLKPANVKITPDDNVKVLDFGLARIAGSAEAGPHGTGLSLLNSPTFTSPAMTNAGVILGTASYMSPEQARGYVADHRSDIFSFGVIAYEMLTGRQPFPGETISDVLASVLARDPDLGALPADLSPRLMDLLKRCLEKNPKKRWQAIGDVKYELDALLSNPRVVAALPPTVVVAPPRPLWRRALPHVATAAGVALLIGAPVWLMRPAAEPPPVTRFTIVPPDGKGVAATALQGLAVSANGRRVAYIAERQIFVRTMSQLEPTALLPKQPETAVYNLEFSPDGESLVYWANGAILRVAAAGGPPVTVCPVGPNTAFGVTWRGDSLLYAHLQKIFRVSAEGGEPEVLFELPKNERPWRPQLLPDGRTVLFSTAPIDGAERNERTTLYAQRVGETNRTKVLENAVDARFVAPRHLVFARQGVVFAVPFDPGTLKVSGGPVPMLEGVRRTGINAQFAVGASGTLAYVPGPAEVSSTGAERHLVIADRSGGREFLKMRPGDYSEPRLARDGHSIAFVSTENGEASIWVHDAKGTSAPRRLTFGAKDRSPIWSADSRRVTFQSAREGDAGIHWLRADGSGVAERLTKTDPDVRHIPLAWSPDGSVLLFDSVKAGEYTLMMFNVSDNSAVPFGSVVSVFPTGAVFSPDGRWVAYSTRTVGPADAKNVIFVQPFPATGARFQISKTGEDAHHQVWGPKGNEILYNAGIGSQVTLVPLTLTPSFTLGDPVTLQRRFVNLPPALPRPLDTMPDGKILAITTDPRPETAAPSGVAVAPLIPVEIRIVLNWIEELKAKVR